MTDDRRSGRWIKSHRTDSITGRPQMILGYECSECGAWVTYGIRFLKYCPNCGAKMEIREGGVVSFPEEGRVKHER